MRHIKTNMKIYRNYLHVRDARAFVVTMSFMFFNLISFNFCHIYKLEIIIKNPRQQIKSAIQMRLQFPKNKQVVGGNSIYSDIFFPRIKDCVKIIDGSDTLKKKSLFGNVRFVKIKSSHVSIIGTKNH